MMISPRFVLIDDNEDHLKALQRALNANSVDGFCIHYDGVNGVGGQTFPSLRTLFIDLHLTSSGASTDDRSHYAQIASILDEIVSADCTPYIMVLWTAYPEKALGLRAYINNLGEEVLPFSKRPLVVLDIAKNDFIDVTNGEVRPNTDLRKKVQDSLTASPQLNALLNWEADVIAAADATVKSIVELAAQPTKQKIADQIEKSKGSPQTESPLSSEQVSKIYAEQLDKILTVLAEMSGAEFAKTNPKEAVNEILSPILTDRIANQDPNSENGVDWSKAITQCGNNLGKQLDDSRSAQILSAIHISIPKESETEIKIGGVLKFDETGDDPYELLFGLKKDALITEAFNIQEKNKQDKCDLRLIRFGAPCDDAQTKNGNQSFLLALEYATSDKVIKKDRKFESKWRSQLYCLPNAPDSALECLASFHHPLALPVSLLPKHQQIYRLRSELSQQLTHLYTRYMSRPGVSELKR